jgi:hypothetical protein
MTRSLKVLPLLALATALVACGGKRGEVAAGGGGEKSEAPARRDSGSVSKATDDIPTSNRTEMYLDRYRFGITTDADGIVVKESDWIPPGSTVAISLYLRNAPAGSELRLVWNDASTKASLGEEIKPVGEKGFVTFKQAKSLPEGSYVAELFFRHPGAKEWRDLGGHNFKVGMKS